VLGREKKHESTIVKRGNRGENWGGKEEISGVHKVKEG